MNLDIIWYLRFWIWKFKLPMKNKLIIVLLFLAVLSLAAFFRLYGVNWDQNQHLHPDERFLTMVATGISWPKDIYKYLDTAKIGRASCRERV